MIGTKFSNLKDMMLPQKHKKIKPDTNYHNCISMINENEFEINIIGVDPWPKDVKLYQPYETEQILLPDSANCLAAQAFLKMCNLDFSVCYKKNAEEMSPSGEIPFIKCGSFLISEFEPIVHFIENKKISLTSHLNEVQKADMRAYMSLVKNVLGSAELYLTWCHNETYKVTKSRYGSVHPFPLNHVLPYLKRRTVLKKLDALEKSSKSLDEVYKEVEKACNILSVILEKEKFFFGDKPTELDALVFGHVFAIVTTPLPDKSLAQIINSYTNLVQHCSKIEKDFFKDSLNKTIPKEED